MITALMIGVLAIHGGLCLGTIAYSSYEVEQLNQKLTFTRN